MNIYHGQSRKRMKMMWIANGRQEPRIDDGWNETDIMGLNHYEYIPKSELRHEQTVV